MTTQNDDLGQLEYVSSAPDLIVQDELEAKPKDVADFSALQQVARLLRDRRKYYASVESLSLGEGLTIENQLLVNKKMLFHIQELESLINTTIIKVKETLNGQ